MICRLHNSCTSDCQQGAPESIFINQNLLLAARHMKIDSMRSLVTPKTSPMFVRLQATLVIHCIIVSWLSDKNMSSLPAPPGEVRDIRFQRRPQALIFKVIDSVGKCLNCVQFQSPLWSVILHRGTLLEGARSGWILLFIKGPQSLPKSRAKNPPSHHP